MCLSPLIKELLFATGRSCYRDPQLLPIQALVPLVPPQPTPAPKAQRTLQKGGQKSQGAKVSAANGGLALLISTISQENAPTDSTLSMPNVL